MKINIEVDAFDNEQVAQAIAFLQLLGESSPSVPSQHELPFPTPSAEVTPPPAATPAPEPAAAPAPAPAPAPTPATSEAPTTAEIIDLARGLGPQMNVVQEKIAEFGATKLSDLNDAQRTELKSFIEQVQHG